MASIAHLAAAPVGDEQRCAKCTDVIARRKPELPDLEWAWRAGSIVVVETDEAGSISYSDEWMPVDDATPCSRLN